MAKKYIVGGLLILIILGVVVVLNRPKLMYVIGRIEAKFSRSKTLGATVLRLNVPFHRQEHSLSCEIAALKMALAGVGADVPESDLIKLLAFDGTVRQAGIWGDPYMGFVGKIDGKMGITGYGVYWDPIARVGAKYRRTEALKNAQINDLTGHLLKGRPIVVWGYYGRGNRLNWQTPTGQQISAVNGEHARTLIGFTGDPANPDMFILMDPIYGELHWAREKFLQNWSALENGAVVVYQHPRWARTPEDETVWEISEDGTTKRRLAMNWDRFVASGGSEDLVAIIDQQTLNQYTEGFPKFFIED